MPVAVGRARGRMTGAHAGNTVVELPVDLVTVEEVVQNAVCPMPAHTGVTVRGNVADLSSAVQPFIPYLARLGSCAVYHATYWLLRSTAEMHRLSSAQPSYTPGWYMFDDSGTYILDHTEFQLASQAEVSKALEEKLRQRSDWRMCQRPTPDRFRSSLMLMLMFMLLFVLRLARLRGELIGCSAASLDPASLNTHWVLRGNVEVRRNVSIMCRTRKVGARSGPTRKCCGPLSRSKTGSL
ncbi:uncharacterized protein MYCFIDRAFT_174443 [Pseudocercospora fijiensis CIRAD86]|uniref:Uncharacterized protein n=1 Tax=Pseudocercospora fijiensis (strain CIRAD86) TaxID=383855 RepID=M2ZVA2_PSEFD|nr:uncharacterized protein MYCFIDRAFT_174443 [Pseudocercospora fijiensis CIRAD86]EME82934.1 hypothetical protein MYCFIDRAFT_174443 [Pseudocercospora fijiensis CIRAD86]